MLKPFAMELYQQYVSGKSAEQLARENHIPIGRIALRLRDAAALKETSPGHPAGHTRSSSRSGE